MPLSKGFGRNSSWAPMQLSRIGLTGVVMAKMQAAAPKQSPKGKAGKDSKR